MMEKTKIRSWIRMMGFQFFAEKQEGRKEGRKKGEEI